MFLEPRYDFYLHNIETEYSKNQNAKVHVNALMVHYTNWAINSYWSNGQSYAVMRIWNKHRLIRRYLRLFLQVFWVFT